MAKTQETNHFSQPAGQKQATAPAQLPMASSAWSEWTLHSSGLHYYRAQYLSYEAAVVVVRSARNAVVADSQGRYIHYEFVGINEVPQSQYYPPPGFAALPVLAAPPVAPPQNLSAPAQLHEQPQVPELEDDGTSATSGTNDAADGAIIDIETGSDAIIVSFPEVTDKHSLVFDKKTRKRLQSEKKRRINPKAKVDTWLRN
ncbi:hypothetical protein B0J13DRAFT_254524 [Dactylonectria estremocensis]|uniref:Uncharacterized protein n=1 Tax=Dactylonectria estremocensis TaxID=1079267 RepID=A0A9P9F2Q0_9HYPO|nr:hypothetical protein B0J13DRAFT_254524 [Dactylonectria estremocensis]